MSRSEPYSDRDIGAEVSPSDEALMERTQQGNRAAFNQLMRRYERPLYNFVRRMIGSAPDAEDLIQEAFLRVYHHRDRYWPNRPFRPWLYRIATNVSKDYLRYQARRRHPSLEAPLADGEGATLGEVIADRAAGPADRADAAERQARLEAALQRLPVKHRTVFLMARYDGLSYDEISHALTIPVGTVKSRMNKAVKLLLEAIEGDAP